MIRRLLTAMLAALLGITGAAAVAAAPAPSPAVEVIDSLESTPTPVPASAFDIFPTLKTPLNILVMGSDLEEQTGRRGQVYQPSLYGRTDTMILIHVAPAERRVSLLSIPRDTRVHIPRHGTTKINEANVYGGPKLAEATVEEYLELPVDRYVLLNTRAFIQLVDALGGVTIYIGDPMHYNDFSQHLYVNFQRGWHRLNGHQAQSFVRFRNDSLGDIGRIRRQQQFIHAMADQALQPATLLKLPQLIKILRNNMETDLTTMEMFRLARWSNGLGRRDLHLVMLDGYGTMIGGGSYWIGQPEHNAAFLQRFRYADNGLRVVTASAHRPRSYSISVKDGVGSRRAANLLVAELRRLGYRAGYGGTIAGMGYAWPLAATQILDARGQDEAGARLHQDLGTGDLVVSTTGDLYSDFTVVLGQDWARQHVPPLPPRVPRQRRRHR